MKTAILSALALLAAAGPVAASPREAAPPAVAVAYADLRLTDPRDATVMLRRIQRAAAAACRKGPFLAGHDAETILRVQACRREAGARAVDGLNAPLVTQAYSETPPRTLLSHLP